MQRKTFIASLRSSRSVVVGAAHVVVTPRAQELAPALHELRSAVRAGSDDGFGIREGRFFRRRQDLRLVPRRAHPRRLFPAITALKRGSERSGSNSWAFCASFLRGGWISIAFWRASRAASRSPS